MKNKSRAFTLIELLVVVLIIGILAAVAVPQYETAVAKTRLATVLPVIAHIAQAEEVYYMANNSYTNELDLLGVDLAACPVWTMDLRKCGNFMLLDPLFGEEGNIRAGYCPDVLSANSTSSFSNCTTQGDLVYTVWFTHSTNPNQTTCSGRTSLGQKICKSMGF